MRLVNLVPTILLCLLLVSVLPFNSPISVSSVSGSSEPSNQVLETIVENINETRFKDFILVLSENIGPRPVDSVSNMEAAHFIAEELNNTDNISAVYQWFSYDDKEIVNVIGTLPSANPANQSKIVLGAHFDTTVGSPGVDDNGSGIAVLLEVAKVLSKFDFNCTIEFVAFNAEEPGLLGSEYYVKEAAQTNQNILLAINVDMCIWDNPNSPSDEKLWIVYNGTIPYEESEQIANSILDINDLYVAAPIQKISSTNDSYCDVNNWTRSDQKSFWDKEFSALWLFEYNGFENPYFNSPADSRNASGYNYTLGAEGAKIIATSLGYLAEVSSKDVLPPKILNVIQIPARDKVSPEDEVEVISTIKDDKSGVREAFVNYTTGNGNWTVIAMKKQEEDIWNATIPPFSSDTEVTYTITAEDKAFNSITTEDTFEYICGNEVVPEFYSTVILTLSLGALSLSAILFKKKIQPHRK